MLLQRRSLRRRRKTRLAACALALIAGVVGFNREAILRRYHQHRSEQALDRARAAIDRGDPRSALLSIQIATQLGGPNLESLRLAAEVFELSDPRGALVTREQVCRLAPESLPDRVACFQAAMRVGDLGAAAATLDAFNESQRATPEVKRLRATLLAAQRRTTEAEAAWAELAHGESPDENARFELAALRIRADDPTVRAAARRDLEAFAGRPGPIQRPAIRTLLADAVAIRRGLDAQNYADQLARLPDATFSDEIRRLNVERLFPLLTRPTIAEGIRQRAAQKAADAAQFAHWLILTGHAPAALVWLEQLPEPFLGADSLRAVRASAFAATRNWGALAAELEAGAWGPVHPMTVGAAMASRQLHETRALDAGRVEWNKALAATDGRWADLQLLLRLSSLWQLDDERIATLRRIAETYPREVWPLQELSTYFFAHKASAELRDTWALWTKHHPENRRVAGDFVMLSLLIEANRPSSSLAEKAEALYRSDPGNPYVASAFALSLWRKKDLGAALAIMAKIPEAERTKPARALLYGAMLAADGQRELAARYLALVKPANLLPEELAMLTQAQSLLGAQAGARVAMPAVSSE